MNTNKKENIAIATSALFTAVAVMHVVRYLFNVDLVIGQASLAMWPSLLAFIAIGYLAILNFKTLERKGAIVWKKFIMALFIIDAIIVFYSWVSNLNYWGFSHKEFGYFLIVEIVIIIILYFKIKKSSGN
ncbi:hypothetical protein A3J61_02485 [Candidatus Nomurabacteria bacterium RIFCSPHIGHO2_02_FULL_38_15]|uniref:Uncharacterized protein n=1 Tax=Candidatus Nomurabacteria bacterium RIFCSPHIGHO2_02_FULL_38_15 TaxID=1801752 RepID=A0A1F6VPS6_9BACT|nr:MAG: hypothetical protein A3J61_02485 [Candidatus Nomurabacteria bacterium RIFCSPHIGHO2_02_FULL_38_15]